MNIFSRFFRMVILDEKAYSMVSKDSFSVALLNLLLVSVAALVPAIRIYHKTYYLVFFFISFFIMAIIYFFVVSFFLWLFARLFGGKGDYITHYIGLTFIGLWGVLYVVPFIGGFLVMLGSLWGVVMNIFLVKNIHKLSMGRSVAAVLLPYFLLLFLVLIIVGFALVAFLLSFKSGSLTVPSMING